jgi:tRNA-specific 2-thiouridylase
MQTTIAMALSGGIDSLVAGYLLKSDGHRVIGLTFRTGFENHAGRPSAAGSQALKLKAHIAQLLKIPVSIIDLSQPFREHVVDYFSATYMAGKTPNPCLVCNPVIKFEVLFEYARMLGATRLATGHYARIGKATDGSLTLLKGVDRSKDQAYFLSRLSQKQLGRALFPLGQMRKQEVLSLAAEKGLTPFTRGESQDVCFIPRGTYAEFLQRQSDFRAVPGPIVNTKGDIIGEHQGLYLFTIGQRRGINCPAARPYYVVRLDIQGNRLVVGHKEDLLRSSCRVEDINWIGSPPDGSIEVAARLRYRHRGAAAVLTPKGSSRATLAFAVPQKAVTPGQGAVFFVGERVLGGGWISAQE